MIESKKDIQYCMYVIHFDIPFGPRLVLTQSATALAATILLYRTSRCFSLPSNLWLPLIPTHNNKYENRMLGIYGGIVEW